MSVKIRVVRETDGTDETGKPKITHQEEILTVGCDAPNCGKSVSFDQQNPQTPPPDEFFRYIDVQLNQNEGQVALGVHKKQFCGVACMKRWFNNIYKHPYSPRELSVMTPQEVNDKLAKSETKSEQQEFPLDDGA